MAERFVAKVVAETKKLRLGDPRAAEVDMGPLTMERQRQVVEEHVEDAKARGARVLTGGEKPAGPGFFYPPTVLTDVDHSMRIMREETFGPVLPIMAVDSLDEAIRLANDSDYGLTASGWTRDPRTARRLAARAPGGRRDDQRLRLAATASPPPPGAAIKHERHRAHPRARGACARWCRSSTSRDDRSRRPAALVVPLRGGLPRAHDGGEPGPPRARPRSRASRARSRSPASDASGGG